MGYESIGIEMDPDFYDLSIRGIPRLMALAVDWRAFEGPNGHHNGLGHGDGANRVTTSFTPVRTEADLTGPPACLTRLRGHPQDD
jgi:hypothetical protein